MNSTLQELKRTLAPMLESEVTRMVLVVWPDEENSIETDVRVNLTLRMMTGKIESYSFFISTDGQTPVVKVEDVNVDYSISEFQQRKLTWQADHFWVSSENVGYEGFLVQPETEYGSIVGANLCQIEVICFQEGLLPTGLAFYFSSGDIMYCIPGITKGTISKEFPSDWFPAPLENVAV